MDEEEDFLLLFSFACLILLWNNELEVGCP